jgi:hypothetical protein|uniref:Uncharacterized protein n=1 Tax=viral metagenome TaxID=1070528 RepID=A0A6C0BUJ3_9ZZZZ
MKDTKYWISLFLHILIWIFSFKLFDIYLIQKKVSQETTIKICVIGLFITFIIYNTDYVIEI